MKEGEIRDLLGDLLRDQNLAVLSTDRGGHPYASLVGFWADPELGHIYFVTTRATRKFDALTSNPRVAMLIDNRSNRFHDFRDAMAATALGEAHEVSKEENQDKVEAYLEKHPHLADFIASPTSALVRVEVSTYYVVTQFQCVMELHLK
jgi:nitroimidazol reductase NimA-like FMN-containing flavoprotein (pyridoxamine 5'-phosphate oxidase superfamily)